MGLSSKINIYEEFVFGLGMNIICKKKRAFGFAVGTKRFDHIIPAKIIFILWNF